jgi:hypothetical protein
VKPGTAGWPLTQVNGRKSRFSLEWASLLHSTGVGTLPMRLAKYVKFREEKFGGVLFDTRSEKVYTLNGVATAVVREIEGGRDRDEILRRLKESFSDPKQAIEAEAVAFIAELSAKGLAED